MTLVTIFRIYPNITSQHIGINRYGNAFIYLFMFFSGTVTPLIKDAV